MASTFSKVVCLSCGHEMPPDPMLTQCVSCGDKWLDARYDYANVNWPVDLARRRTSLWRYTELLPVSDDTQRVSLGEGWTPLIPAARLGESLGHKHLFIKDERQSP